MEESTLDMQKLLHALDNENNASIADQNYRQIAKDKNDILQKLQLSRDALKKLHNL